MRCQKCGAGGAICNCPTGPDNPLGDVQIVPPPCIHGDGTNLCESCQGCYDVDPQAYVEYGDHPGGLERWRQAQEVILAGAAESIVPRDPPYATLFTELMSHLAILDDAKLRMRDGLDYADHRNVSFGYLEKQWGIIAERVQLMAELLKQFRAEYIDQAKAGVK